MRHDYVKEGHVNFRAVVIIHGAVPQKIYGKDPVKVNERARKALTEHRPGDMSLSPSHYELQKFKRRISGRLSEWETIDTVKFASIPEDAREYVKRRKARETAIHMSAQKIQLPCYHAT